MQGLSLIVAAILLMVAFNLLMVLATVGAKVLRSLNERRLRARRERLEPALYDFLATGEIPPALHRTKDFDVLSFLIVELLTVLRGSDQDRLMRLTHELGLVRRDIGRLRSRQRWRRARAAENLGYFGGPDAAGPLGELLSDEDETVRAVAARALSRIGTQEAAYALARTLNDPSELTSLRAAENLERIGSLAVEPLIGLLDSDERRAQVLAARILGNLRVSEARPALRRVILRRWNTDLRAQATLALGKIGDPADIPTMLEACNDNSWPVRVQAANALGMIGEVSTIPTLERLMADPEWWVRSNAGRALVNMGPEGERALVKVLEGPDRFARDRAAATLEGRGVIRRVVGELLEPGERGRAARAMVRAMVRAGTTRHLVYLAKMGADEERRVLREVIAESYGY